MIEITLIPMLEDNYAYLLIGSDGTTAIIDPAAAKPAIEALNTIGRKLDYILNTHHHYDHTDGNLKLKSDYDCTVIGPAAEADRIPGIDKQVQEGDSFMLGEDKVIVLNTPGHTLGHICFYFPQDKALFCGDVLFSMSCGRLFEGTAYQMWNSFEKIMALPDDTKVYCGHEYTVENGEFALTIEPDNDSIKTRLAEARALRAKNLPTIPSTLAQEKATNVMLRAGSAARFKEIRALKDKFN